VIDNSDKNKMTLGNILTCTCGYIITLAPIFNILISNYDSIFGDDGEEFKTEIFGVKLEVAAKRSKDNIPSVLKFAIEYINEKGLEIEGIYRVIYFLFWKLLI